MITKTDETFLRRAMRLAMNGRGHVEPNPMVGCVLVKNGQIIGEGWHQTYGQAHAEPTALNDCKSRGNDPADATAYVTLEPCCHSNKKTPPCAPRLIDAKITRVVIGCLDPNPDVNGKGVAMLREAGIEVDVLPGRNSGTGVPPVIDPTRAGRPCHELDASHFQQLIAPFILRQSGTRPYVTLKWAMTADGKVAGANGKRLQISNEYSTKLVHQLRARCDAIIVGINTVLADNPLLTARGVPEPRRAVRVILDSHLRTPLDSNLVQTAREQTVRVFGYGSPENIERAAALTELGVDVDDVDTMDVTLKNGDQRMSLTEMLFAFSQDTHALVEPGPTLARALFGPQIGRQQIVDRLWVFQSSTSLNEATAPCAADIPPHFLPVATLNLAGDVLTEYLNTQSPAFFAPVPSADFVLAQDDVARATSP